MSGESIARDLPRAPVRGVVLCGGQSRRMGRDKALIALEPGGPTLVEAAAGMLAQIADEVVLACGPDERYSELGLPLVLDAPEFRGAGPLAGLEAALRDGAGWNLVLACDMPGTDVALWRRLLESARGADADACLLSGPRGIEPLCGVFRGRLHTPVLAALAAAGSGSRGARALGWLEERLAAEDGGGPPSLATIEGGFAQRRNLNAPEDVRALSGAPRGEQSGSGRNEKQLYARSVEGPGDT